MAGRACSDRKDRGSQRGGNCLPYRISEPTTILSISSMKTMPSCSTDCTASFCTWSIVQHSYYHCSAKLHLYSPASILSCKVTKAVAQQLSLFYLAASSVRRCMDKYLDIKRSEAQVLHAVPVVYKVTESETTHAQTLGHQ